MEGGDGINPVLAAEDTDENIWPQSAQKGMNPSSAERRIKEREAELGE